jgi:hypothetical protein
VNIIDGIYWTKKAPIFREYIKECLEEREKNRHKNIIKSEISKLKANGLYGIQGLREITEEHIIKNNEDITNIEIKKEDKMMAVGKNKTMIIRKNKKIKYKLPHIAAFILSYTKQKLFNIIGKVGEENVKYGDTDSLIINTKSKNKIEKEMEMKINGWKWEMDESIIVKRITIGPKTYLYKCRTRENKTKYKIKMKGVDKPKKEEIKEEDFEKLRKGDNYIFIRKEKIIKKEGIGRGLKKYKEQKVTITGKEKIKNGVIEREKDQYYPLGHENYKEEWETVKEKIKRIKKKIDTKKYKRE